ncbi:MAG: hypothetical protein COS89_02300 [Deltaproteobacteria bacterium CG07_land_8_20_14_0_80_38_7]|nr:MAG: hypothetical protein COS89_02300 [Deltaproteobacteria bacterium CG07_land_8_20_14_0_80_38_7]
MKNKPITIGIRREDKNRWEARVPLIPSDIKKLGNTNLKFIVQPSTIRTFSDAQYKKAGAKISEDLSQCDIIFAVKEIPEHLIQNKKVYIFFSHTIKGQSHNMPMLKRIIDSKSTLIDYEKILDKNNKKIIFFGKYAGLAGMIDTLMAFGQKISYKGIKNPFEKIKQAIKCKNLDDAIKNISAAGKQIEKHGLNPTIAPVVIGIAGYGNVAKGVQRIVNLLPIEEISPDNLINFFQNRSFSNKKIYKTVFYEKDMVAPVKSSDSFELQDYFKNPEKYKSQFKKYLPCLSMLVNCIYWDKRYPRLVTKKDAELLFKDDYKLKVIGDISCDVEGAIEITVKSTSPDNPVYTYNPSNGSTKYGVSGNGPVILAVDNLPCELPKESSEEFSDALKPYVAKIYKADFNASFENLSLPPEIKKAVIVHKGKLTPDYKYLKKHLRGL